MLRNLLKMVQTSYGRIREHLKFCFIFPAMLGLLRYACICYYVSFYDSALRLHTHMCVSNENVL